MAIFLTILFLFLCSSLGQTYASESGGREHVTYEITVDNYNPPILELSKNSGKINRGWIEQKNIREETESFTDTRTVVDYYKEVPKYRKTMAPSFLSLSGAQSDLKDESDRTLSRLKSKDEDWWLSYCQSTTNGRATNFDMTPNSHQEFEYGFQYFQGFIGWITRTVRPSGTLRFYRVEIPSRFQFLKESGKYKEPVYTEEEYTRWRTTTYEIIDHVPESWEDKK